MNTVISLIFKNQTYFIEGYISPLDPICVRVSSKDRASSRQIILFKCLTNRAQLVHQILKIPCLQIPVLVSNVTLKPSNNNNLLLYYKSEYTTWKVRLSSSLLSQLDILKVTFFLFWRYISHTTSSQLQKKFNYPKLSFFYLYLGTLIS